MKATEFIFQTAKNVIQVQKFVCVKLSYEQCSHKITLSTQIAVGLSNFVTFVLTKSLEKEFHKIF